MTQNTSQTPRRRGFPPLVGVVIMLVGTAILVGLYWVSTQQQQFASITERATGTVIDLTRYESRTRITFAPVIEFTTPQGRRYTFTGSSASNPPAYEIGDQVEILYNPENPQDTVIAAYNSFTASPFLLMLGLIGVILVLYGGSIVFRALFPSQPRPTARLSGRS